MNILNLLSLVTLYHLDLYQYKTLNSLGFTFYFQIEFVVAMRGFLSSNL
jgi:tRNA A37 threonylcarbamoyladenosine biosynthesis protein TsaE